MRIESISWLGVLDGFAFSVVYLVACVTALVWSFRLSKRGSERFGKEGAESIELRDPYEIGFLAGGLPRVAQLAVVDLLIRGDVEWIPSRLFRSNGLKVRSAASVGLAVIPGGLYKSILGYREKGMILDQVAQAVEPHAAGIEARLAKLGLRPTSWELRGRGFFSTWPVFLLMAIGFLGMYYQMSADRSVGITPAIMVVTFLAGLFLSSKRKRLTPQGEQVLLRMRAAQTPAMADEGVDGLLWGLALFGPLHPAADPALRLLEKDAAKAIATVGRPSSDGGDGFAFGGSGCGSSGCGSSGCGSSGCGGGGCGGD